MASIASPPLTPKESVLLALCRRHPGGVTNEQMEKAAMSAAERVNSLNMLLQKGRLAIIRTAEGELLYNEVPEEEAKKLRGLTAADLHIFRCARCCCCCCWRCCCCC